MVTTTTYPLSQGYLRGSRTFLLALPDMGTLNLVGKKFQYLKAMEKHLPSLTRKPRPQYILAGSLRLIETRADHCRRSYHNRNVA